MTIARWAVLALTIALLPAPAWAGAPARTRIAVTDITAVQGVSAGTARLLGDIIASEVARAGKFEVITSSDVATMLDLEKRKALLSCGDASCLANIGGALGVDYLLYGQVGQIGKRDRVTLILVDVKRSSVLAREGAFCDATDDALAEEVQRGLKRLLVALGGPAPASPAASPEPIPTVKAATSGSSGHLGPIVTMSAGGALLVGGGVAALVARSRYDALASHPSTWDADHAGVKTAAVAADALLGAGIVAAAGGLVWLLVQPSPGAVAVAPSVSPGAVGIACRASF